MLNEDLIGKGTPRSDASGPASQPSAHSARPTSPEDGYSSFRDSQLDVIPDEEASEYDELLKQHKMYAPTPNGRINDDYVNIKAKIQKQLDTNGELKNIKVSPQMIEQRRQRVLDNDSDSLQRVREKVEHIDDGVCENLISKSGAEIVHTIECVAFLNAPQSYADHLGRGKLFLTRRKRRKAGKDLEANDVAMYTHRLYFYMYGESPRYEGVEEIEDMRSTFCMCDKKKMLGVEKKESSVRFETEDFIHRSAKGSFTSLPVENVLNIHHALSDVSEMRRHVKSTLKTSEQLPWCECGWCLTCLSCCAFVLTCGCLRIHCCVVHEMRTRTWNWTLSAFQTLNNLGLLVSGDEYKSETRKEDTVYHPIDKVPVPGMETVIKSEAHWRKFHTLEFTYVDHLEHGKKHRGVAVLAPGLDTEIAMDWVCNITNLAMELQEEEYDRVTASMGEHDSRMYGWRLKQGVMGLLFDERGNPLSKFSNLLNADGSVFTALSGLLGGGITIEVVTSVTYQVNGGFVIVLSFIATIIALAFVADSPILILPAIYSLVHCADRIYNFRNRLYTTYQLKKDLAYAFFGLIAGGLSAAYDASSSAAAGVAALTILQSLFAFFGSCYQLAQHFGYVPKASEGGIVGAFGLQSMVTVGKAVDVE